MPPRKRNGRKTVYAHKGIFGYPNTPTALKALSTLNAKEREQHMHTLAEALPQIVWTAEPSGYQDYFNQRWFEYTGLTEKETYAGKTALHSEDFPVYKKAWAKALKSGKAYEAEYRFRRASDGTYRWHLVRGLPVKDRKGKILKWFGTFTDIDDRKRLNEELERRVTERTLELRGLNRNLEAEIAERKRIESRDQANIQLLRAIFQVLPMGAVVIDEQWNVLHVNGDFCKIFNLQMTPSQWIGRSGVELFEEISPKLLHPVLDRARLESLLESKREETGAEVQLKSESVLTRDYVPIIVDGVAKGHLFLFRDVTRERRADAAKSEFMSLASHQLRTPVTAIRWALGRIARSEVLSDRGAQLVTAAKTAASNMAETISTMLMIARIEAGQVQLEMEEIQLCAFLKDLTAHHAALLEKKDLHLSLTCNTKLKLTTDTKILHEILLNLFVNALKYTPRKGRVEIRAKNKGAVLLLEVKDTGLGIPRHQQKQVFSKFFRAENVTQHVTDGTGLGLYLVSLLVRLIDGKISFSSIEGKGTTFSLELPRQAQIGKERMS